MYKSSSILPDRRTIANLATEDGRNFLNVIFCVPTILGLNLLVDKLTNSEWIVSD